MGKTLATQRSLARNIVDITGLRFGRLVALRYVKKSVSHRHGAAYWLCRCDCGKEKVIKSQHLRSGHVISCRCANAELTAATCRRNAARKFNPEVTGARTVFLLYRQSARSRHLEFSIPQEELTLLIKKNCQYCAMPPSNKQFNRSKVRPYSFRYNGLDRVDNSKGYVSGNCVPCCDRCNTAKQESSVSEFLSWVSAVYAVSCEK